MALVQSNDVYVMDRHAHQHLKRRSGGTEIRRDPGRDLRVLYRVCITVIATIQSS